MKLALVVLNYNDAWILNTVLGNTGKLCDTVIVDNVQMMIQESD